MQNAQVKAAAAGQELVAESAWKTAASILQKIKDTAESILKS
eukprot:gene6039-15614_t